MKFEVVVSIDSSLLKRGELYLSDNDEGKLTEYYGDVSRLTFNDDTLRVGINNDILDINYDNIGGILFFGDFSYDYEPTEDEEMFYIRQSGRFIKRFSSFAELLMFMKNRNVDGEDGIITIDVSSDNHMIKVKFRHSNAYPIELESADEFRYYVGREPDTDESEPTKFKIESDWKELNGVEATHGIFKGIDALMFEVNGVKSWIPVSDLENFYPDSTDIIYLSQAFASEHSVNIPVYVDDIFCS